MENGAKVNEIGAIFGRQGMGKTTLARQLIEQSPRNIVLDTLGDDYAGGCVVDGLAGLVAYWNRVRGFERFTIIFKPKNDQERNGFFRLAVQVQNVVIWIDEVDTYCSPGTIKKELWWLLNYGRHQGISVVALARRPQDVHRKITAAAGWIIAHQTHEPRDLKYFSERFSDVSRIPHLRPFEWAWWGQSKMFDFARKEVV